jgi:hypothetical protein
MLAIGCDPISIMLCFVNGLLERPGKNHQTQRIGLAPLCSKRQKKIPDTVYFHRYTAPKQYVAKKLTFSVSPA